MIGVFVPLTEPTGRVGLRHAMGYVVQENGCWEWVASKTHGGYGHFAIGSRFLMAHRFVYESEKGIIPPGLELDHLCRNPSCVRPDHLEAVTPRVNTLRSNSLPAQRARRTHCPKNHPLTPDNLVASQLRRGHRKCRICTNEFDRQRPARKRRKLA